MATSLLERLAINEDVESEFHYWKKQFVFAAWMAVCLAVATGVAIAVWPDGAGDQEMRAFARHFWTLFAECMFWLGFFLGLLWAGAKRFGSAFSGTLPWQSAKEIGRALAMARLFGQWSVCLLLLGVGFWLTGRIALMAGAEIAGALPALEAMNGAVFSGAALCGLAALFARRRARQRH